MVDPRITQAFEDGRVTEEGITPEFLSESKDQEAIIAIIFVTALTFFIVCCRLLSRIFIVKRFGVDDALALCGLVSMPLFGCKLQPYFSTMSSSLTQSHYPALHRSA